MDMNETYLYDECDHYSWQCDCGAYWNDCDEEVETVQCEACGREFKTVLWLD